MQDIIYILAALNQFYRSAHWRSNGVSFYQNHLLFSRLYESIDQEIDDLVELFIAYRGEDGFASPRLFTERSLQYMPSGEESLIKNLEAAAILEDNLLGRIQKENPRDLPVGIYNKVASIAESHTHNLYLIRQTLKNDVQVTF